MSDKNRIVFMGISQVAVAMIGATLVLLFLTGCGELGMSASDMITVSQDFVDDNTDLDAASECLIEADTDYYYDENTEKVYFIEVKIDRDCIVEVIKDKQEE